VPAASRSSHVLSDVYRSGRDKMKEKGMDADSTISKGMDELNNINTDSLKQKVEESMQKLEEAKKALDQK
jgi:threonine synthase